MPFLYEIFDNPFARKALLGVAVPPCIGDNLRYGIRPYQEEAFKRYVYFDTEDFDGKPTKPVHLLYNMATGSGKTQRAWFEFSCFCRRAVQEKRKGQGK